MKNAPVVISARAAVLGLLLLAAVALRLAGITWGLPGTYNSDEPHIVNTALAYAGSFPRPYDFKYPALWPTVLFFFYGLYFLVWSCLGLCHKVYEFIGLYGWNPGGFYLIGRLLSSVFSVAGALTVAHFESSWRGRSWPWAALSLAFAPFIVESAHSCKPDCLMLFWSCLAWIAAIEIYRAGSQRSYWACGACVGLAVSTQYTAAPLALVLPAAHLCGLKAKKTAWLFQGVAAAAGAFLLTSPYTVLDYRRFWTDMADFRDLARLTAFDERYKKAVFPWVLRNVANFTGPGSIAGMAIVLGLARLWIKERGLCFLFLIPILGQVTVVTISSDGVWGRYLFDVFPGLAFLLGESIAAVEGFRRPLLTVLAAVLCFLPGFLRSASADRQMRLPDTRPQAERWIKANVPAGAALLVDLPHASPNLAMTKDEIQELERKTRASGSLRARLYGAMERTHPGGGYRLYRIRRQAVEMFALPGQVERSQADYPMVDVRPGLDVVRAMRIDYVVTTSWGADPQRVPEMRTFFDELYAHARFLKDFVPEPGASAGPVLRVFKLSR